MAELTPKERVNRLFKREPIDTMPCFSGMGMVTIQVINEMGIRFPEVHTSAEYLARSAVLTAEMFGFDAAIIPYDMGRRLFERAAEPRKFVTLVGDHNERRYLGDEEYLSGLRSILYRNGEKD